MSPYELDQKVDILRSACDVADIGTWEWDFSTNQVCWNRGMARLMNADQDRLNLSSAESMVGILADDLPEIHERVGAAIRDHADYSMQFRVACNDGSVRCLHSHGKAVYDAHGKASALVGITFKDEARTAGELAERAGRMTDEFLATLSHELRTPLNAVLGWAQILRLKTKDGTDDLKRGVEAIERNARLQSQLIDDMLDMSRIIAGKVRLEAHVLYPFESIDAAIETVQPAASVKGVLIEKTVAPKTGQILADPGRLHQIVWNLLSNAVKFTPAGGTVRVALMATDEQVVIEVTDNGVGMQADLLEHVFERLHQETHWRNRAHNGLGLGLAIVKQLVDLHGGGVQASSPGVGLGTTMTVMLPLVS